MEAADVSVLIPYQSDRGPRDAAMRYVKAFYGRMLPEAEICVGELTAETFSRSKAINKAASAATGSKWIIADGDILYDPELMRHALRLLKEDNWVIPFTSITRLTLSNSQAVFQTEAGWPLQVPVETKPDDARYFVGGVSVVTRKAFEKIGGYDERFVGWGGEDEAFAYSMDTIIGKHIRLEGNLLHFWHPFVGPSGNPNYGKNYELFQAYRSALGNRSEMIRLIQDKKEGRTPP